MFSTKDFQKFARTATLNDSLDIELLKDVNPEQYEKLLTKFKASISEKQANAITKDEFNKVLGEKDALLEKHAEQFAKMEAKIKKLESEKPASLNKDQIFSKAAQSLAKEVSENVKAGKKLDIEKTAETVLPTDIANRNLLTGYLGDISRIAVREPFLMDLVNVTTISDNGISGETISYRDEVTSVRDAQMYQGHGDITTTTKVEWETRQLVMKNVKDYISISNNMLDDYAFVESEIRRHITESLLLKVDEQLYKGDAPTLANDFNGLQSYATAFNAAEAGADVSAKTTGSQALDLIRAIAAQIQISGGGGSRFSANYALMNPIDIFAYINALKDANNNYLEQIRYNETGMLLVPHQNGFVRIVSNPLVDSGECMVGDFSKATLYVRKGLELSQSPHDGTNFRDDLVTFKARMRGNLLVRENDRKAFRYVTDMDAAIAAINV